MRSSTGPDRAVVVSVPWAPFYGRGSEAPPKFARLISRSLWPAAAGPQFCGPRSPWRSFRLRRVGGANRCARPLGELGGILEHLERHAEVRHRDRPVGDGPERFAAGSLV